MHGKVERYVKVWEQRCYSDGIPDEAPQEITDKVPSYKRIAIAILKNDAGLASLGFTPKVSEYYHALKRIEIESRIAKGEKMKLQPEKKPKVMSTVKRLEVEYLKTRLPYAANVYFTRSVLAPEEDKSTPTACTIVAVDDVQISIHAGGVTNTYKHSDIAKIAPANVVID